LLANGQAVHLGPHAFDLLVALVEQSGHLVTKDELLGRVWSRVVVEENTLQAHISALRKVLGASAITTVSGRGYRFSQEVILIGAAAGSSASALKHNLPHALTSFIGREKEMAELAQLLGTARLLTLTGAGGCGKTRLAIELARQRAHAYPDGACLVELAALSDAALVPDTVAAVLGIKEKAGARVIDTLTEYLASRSALLVLDNAEHLIEACAQLSESLLRRCARLVILVTSRERLGITGELIYRVPSLSMPDEEADTTPESIAAYESARLFIERARLQLPQFAVNTQNSAAVASICRRLDGIALALELAAPRVRTLSVEELSRGLDHRFELLTGGSRTALPRHRTLRALINWSYDLLTDAEKAMLRTVSVFVGGWTLEAARKVFDVDQPDGSNVLDLLTSLVDKNLIAVDAHDGATRYSMLETVRDYARERLSETSEQARLQDRHLAFFLALAEQANREKSDAGAAAWLDRLETERDNFRSALSWSIESPTDDASVRLAGALCWFWLVRGHVTEGRHWLGATLGAPGPKPDYVALTYALRGASLLAQRQDDHVAARRAAEESLAILTQAGDRRGMARSWQSLGVVAHSQADYRSARDCYEQALALFRELDDGEGIHVVLSNLGHVALNEGRYDEAGLRLAESVAVGRKVNDWHLPHALTALGATTHHQGNPELARRQLTEALEAWRKRGDPEGTAWALDELAIVALDGGDHPGALSLLREALVIKRDLGHRTAIAATSLSRFGRVAVALGESVAAARFWGQARRLREDSGSVAPTSPQYERRIAELRAAMGEEAFHVAWDEGRAMTLDQAVDYALEFGSGGPTEQPKRR
jgi:predicted ATPase/DNA-binding winged helix-turn-helix (wHTH) protein/Tfp pilus assembly protein PilF